MTARRGSVLIVTAGIAALLAALALAFLARMRDDADEMGAVTRDVQARLMLLAACNYLQEASRIGWDAPPASGPHLVHHETFGWIDVRDGTLGPKFDATGHDDDHFWPLYRARRFPMHVLNAPPFATRLDVVYNEIRTPTVPTAGPWPAPLGRPYLEKPDPQPVFDGWAAYRAGDPRPRPDSTGLAWFRIFRDGGARFVVTCGAGATEGYRDWPEVVHAGAQAEFGDQAVFETLRALEVRRWYRVEWSGAVQSPDYHNLDNDIFARDPDNGGSAQPTHIDSYQEKAMNASQSSFALGSCRTQNHVCDPVGTIRWVQRLREEPTWW